MTSQSQSVRSNNCQKVRKPPVNPNWLSSRKAGSSKKIVTLSTESEEFQLSFDEFRTEMRGTWFVGVDIEGHDLENYKKRMRGIMGKEQAKAALDMDEQMKLNIEKQRPLLLQLSTLSGFTLLLRIGAMRDLPPRLINFLTDTIPFKVGVNIMEDSRWMLSGWGVKMWGCIDLKLLCLDTKCAVPNEVFLGAKLGLKSLATGIFGANCVPFEGADAESARLLAWSNWGQRHLTEKQLSYAAFDSQVSVDIAAVCMEKLGGVKFTDDGAFVDREKAAVFRSKKLAAYMDTDDKSVCVSRRSQKAEHNQRARIQKFEELDSLNGSFDDEKADFERADPIARMNELSVVAQARSFYWNVSL